MGNQSSASEIALDLPTLGDVKHAASRLEGHAVKTPLINSRLLDELTGARVFLKAECLQHTGSFKFRGAFNALSRIDESKRQQGVVACSSGNHAQGVAEAARLLGMPAIIVMPDDAPRTKTERTKRSGATVVPYDRAYEDRDEIAAELCHERNATFIHPYNNPNVIAGQGTVGLEIAEELIARSLVLDEMFVCTGGGGLTAGIALALTERFPDCAIHTVEPEGFDDYKRSLETGERQMNSQLSGSVCDAVLTHSPGERSFEICRPRVADGRVVSDEEALAAVKFAFEELKLVVEPGGAVALAAILQAGRALQGKTVCATLSGGNIDHETMALGLEH